MCGRDGQAEQADLRRPHGIGKPRQRLRPERDGLVDQIYHGLKVIFLGHGKGLGRKIVCKKSGYRFALTTRPKIEEKGPRVHILGGMQTFDFGKCSMPCIWAR